MQDNLAIPNTGAFVDTCDTVVLQWDLDVFQGSRDTCNVCSLCFGLGYNPETETMHWTPFANADTQKSVIHIILSTKIHSRDIQTLWNFKI